MKDKDVPKHEWAVGDICTCTYQGIAGGLLYMVTEVRPPSLQNTDRLLKIKPVYGVFQSLDNRKTRVMSSDYCIPHSIIELGMEYARLGNFIRDVALARAKD